MQTLFSPTRSITGKSRTRRPSGHCGSARLVLMLAWVAFWLNTALFPCCEALAAALSNHSDISSQPASGAQSAHHSAEAHVEHVHPSPSSPCKDTVKSVSAIPGAYAQLPTSDFQPEWFAIDGPVASDLKTPDQSAILAPREYQPPPLSRVYLQTQRLLI